MQHQKLHRHAPRRLYKRDDPPTVNLDVTEADNSLERRVNNDVATVYSVVYVTASATFKGPTAGFVTLSADPTTTAKATKTQTSKKNDDDDDDTATSTKSKQTSTTEKSSSTSSVKSTATASTSRASGSSASSSSSLATSSTTLATSSIAASSSVLSSSIASSGVLAAATISSSATASASAVSDSSGTSGGAKAGIAFAVIAIIGVLAGLAYFFIHKKKAQQKEGMQKLDDEKKAFINNNASNGPSNAPAPPTGPLNSQPPPRLSYRPGSQFAPKVLGDAEKAAAGASAGAAAGAMLGAQTGSAWERPPTNATNDPSNPFGIHAQTVDAQSKEKVSPVLEDRSLSPPVELQGSPVPSPTQASFPTEVKPEVGTASVVALPAVAAAVPGADPAGPPANNVHRVQLEFKPSMEDELELKVGQIVRVLHEYDDGWALCIRMDRSQQGVAPRTCLSKLPLKPRPMGPAPNGNANVPAHGPPQGPPRPGPGPNARQALPSQAPLASQPVRPAPQESTAPRPLSPPTDASPKVPSINIQSPQKRSRSMSVATPSSPGLQSQQDAASPAKIAPDAHRRSVSLSSMGNANAPSDGPVGPSPLGVAKRKPVPGQAM